MKFTDMDMLQDYEKDTRMAVVAYSLIQTEIMDNKLRSIIQSASIDAAGSQKRASNLIIAKGDRP